MKYRTRKLIEHIIDTVVLVIVAVSVGYLFMKMRNLNNINYKRLYRKIERLPKNEIDYFNGEKQTVTTNLKRDHDVFLGDLEFENVDPLSADEFEDGKWDESKVMGSKSYYRDGKKLSSSVSSTIMNYFDENYDYEMRIKKYNELLADVRKPLEYKDDGKKKDKKSTSRWGRKGKKEEKKKEEKKPVPTEPDEITPKPFPSMDASALHAKGLTDSQGETVNLYPAKVSVLPSDATYLGREGMLPTGVWADSTLTKIYILPLGSHKIDDYENASTLLDGVISILKEDRYRVFTWSEVEYFERWYRYKEPTDREAIKSLVTTGQLEFLLGGWSTVETENVLVDDLINIYEEAQRWLFEEFGYRCPIAYLKPSIRVNRELASLLHDGGVEMLIVDGAEEPYYNSFLQNKSVEFLWETDPFTGVESRLFTHISGDASSSLWAIVRRIMNNEGEEAVKEFISHIQSELPQINDNRYLMIWPIDSSSSYSEMYSFLNTISSFGTNHHFISSVASGYRYLLDVHGGSSVSFPSYTYQSIQIHSVEQTGLYSSLPLLWDRVHLGSRFLSVFERFYAYCAIQGTCSNVPKVTPDTAMYSGNNYFPAGKPEDLVYYNLHRARRLQASAFQHGVLMNGYDPADREASRIYGNYHRSLLAIEKQAGRMFTTLIGIGERVSPNEIDEDSIYSIYHRTIEWTKKKEIGVMVFNSFPTRSKELIRLRVATSDLCAYNGKMKARHQITQINNEEYELLLSVKLAPHSYTTYILRWCEGTDKLEGETSVVNGRYLDGDAYRVHFNEFGRFVNVTNKLDSVSYDFEMEVGVVTPASPDTPDLFKPHGLPPDDPLYLNPYIKRLVPNNKPLSFSGLRGNLMNVMVQHYGDSVDSITRFVRSIGVDKKITSRSHLLDCSFNIKKKPEEGELVAYIRFKDVHNHNRIHVTTNGMEYDLLQTQEMTGDLGNDYFLKNVFAAGSGTYIQDEDIDRTKGDIARISAFFSAPRGVTTMEEGSLVFPLTVGGKKSKAVEEEDEGFRMYDLNRDYQHIAISVQHSDKGLMAINEKIFSSILSRGHFFMYYNNTKENKDNTNLKLTATLMKPNIAPQINIITFKKINSLDNRYLLRLQNSAEYDDGYSMNDNVVTIDLAAAIKSLKLKFVAEVSAFGVSEKESVEKGRFIWTAQDGKKSSGSVRTLQNMKSVTFFPLQIRTFVLSSD